jgi:hypothetical protein
MTSYFFRSKLGSGFFTKKMTLIRQIYFEETKIPNRQIFMMSSLK